MDLYSLTTAIRDAVAQDAAMDTWATVTFEKSVTVFVGLIGERSPEHEIDAPFVVLGEMTDTRGMESRTINYEISGWIGMYSPELRDDSAANIIEAEGTEQIMAAHKLVRNAIIAGLPTNIQMIEYSTMSDTLGVENEVNGYFSARFDEKITIGTNPMN